MIVMKQASSRVNFNWMFEMDLRMASKRLLTLTKYCVNAIIQNCYIGVSNQEFQ